MSDQLPTFETSDLQGSSSIFSSTVGTSWTAVPSVAGNAIQSVMISCNYDQTLTNELKVSLDNGSTEFPVLYPGGCFSFDPKGEIKQIYIKGNVALVSYSVTLSREVF